LVLWRSNRRLLSSSYICNRAAVINGSGGLEQGVVCGFTHTFGTVMGPIPVGGNIVRYYSSWIDQNFVPEKVRPYLHLARADKQVGTLLLMWPCVWSTCLAAPIGCAPDIWLLAKFAIGSVVMRGAGCTINDLWDKDFDKHVERTKSRPLASGAISVPQALTFLGLQLSCGLGVLVSLNVETVLLGLCSMPFVVCYPLMKRFTNWPQFVLGLTFNWGALVGWSASASSTSNSSFASTLWHAVYCNSAGTTSSIDDATIDAVGDNALAFGLDATGTVHSLASTVLDTVSIFPVVEDIAIHALPLYGAGVCWTLIYDTLYGYQDRKDDAKIGLKSTALYLGDRPQPVLTGLSCVMLSGILMAGHSVHLTTPFYFGAAAMWVHSIWQIWTADVENPQNLWVRFNSNKYSGGLLAAAIIAGHY